MLSFEIKILLSKNVGASIHLLEQTVSKKWKLAEKIKLW